MFFFDKKTRNFNELYSDYYPLIFASINSRTNNSDIAKDICQEVFIRFYEKFDSVENPRKWLFGTLRLVTFEYFRKNNKNEEDIDLFSEDSSLGLANEMLETRNILNEALESLSEEIPSNELILFELIALYDFSYKTAAEQTGVTEHQARYKYNRIIKKLLDYLKTKGINNLEELL